MEFLNTSANYAYSIGMVGVFIGVCLLFSGVYHMVIGPMARKRQLASRLKNTGRERLAKVQILKTSVADEKGLLLAVIEKLTGWGKIDHLQNVLLQADIFWRPTTFISVIGILFCAGFILIWLWRKDLLLGIGLGALLAFIPIVILRLKRSRKARLFEIQMPECMELLARSMRAGHALPSAIELAFKEMTPPMGLEMKIVYEEQRLGLGLLHALRRLGERVDSQDLQYFITAVLLQVETGGNLAEILDNIGFLIRERLKLKGKIQALTAEGRFSALVLTLLPFVIFVVITILNPRYINTLVNEPVGMKLITGGLISIGFGILWMRKIIQIKV